MKNDKYIGRIASVPGHDGYAFIGLTSVTKNDDTPHGLDTTADIFLHQDECSAKLGVGMKVIFTVVPDTTRGSGHYRAMCATEYVDDAELLPTDTAPMEGFSALAPFGAVPTNLAVSPTAAQRHMKVVDPTAVNLALTNQPAAGIPRDSSIPSDLEALMQAFLQYLFPALAQFGTHFRLDVEETELEQQLAAAREDHLALGMNDQITVLETEVRRFLSFRKALGFMVGEKLVRRDTIIPIQYLPDFFSAVPVWYFWADEDASKKAEASMAERDPQVHEATQYFCDLFPNQNWADMFQIYNRRMRTLRHYKGDLIPPSIIRRIREVSHLFDYVAIMTPYHDEAGKDWQNLAWVRSIDPYVVGFKKGIPFFFILGRFSDSGTFPLFTELVADTVQFLGTHKNKLTGFNSADNPYWHIIGKPWSSFNTMPNKRSHRLGDHLKLVVDEALKAFKQGKLFDWLRGESLTEKLPG